MRRMLGWAALALVCVGLTARADDSPVAPDLILKGGTVVDGTGGPKRTADVALKGDRIIAVGEVVKGPKTKVIDVAGMIVAPGFIDLHTHSDESILQPKTRNNLNYQAQGVTTVVTGNCGSGPVDVSRYFEQIEHHGAGTNVIHLVPLGSVRGSAMGNAERRPNADELRKMERLVEAGMKAGAWGVSTGLIYLPGRYADRVEIAALATIAARHGGIYASHIRNEEAGLLGALDEALDIGKLAGIPVHISHLKASGKANWGMVVPACEKIAEARKAGRIVTADQYPYVASSTKLAAMVIPHWALQGNEAAFARIADDPDRGPRLRREIQAELDERDGGASVKLARYAPKPARVGRDLVTIAARRASSRSTL